MTHPLYALPAVRAQRGVSLADLAQQARITPETVRRLEQGHPPKAYATWRQLAAALDCPPDALLHLGSFDDCPDCSAYRRRVFPAV